MEQLNKGEQNISNDKIIIELKNPIVIPWFLLNKYSRLIQNNYKMKDAQQNLSQQINEFKNINKIEEECIHLYFRYLYEDKISITNENFRSILLLANFFQDNHLNEFLIQYINDHKNDIDWLIQQILDDIRYNRENDNNHYEFQKEIHIFLSIGIFNDANYDYNSFLLLFLKNIFI